jgi:hypothetical protein
VTLLFLVGIYNMKICSKCNVERNDDEYYSYWHSTQQKYRTRLVCGVCTREQSKQYKLNRKNKLLIVEEVPTQHCPQCKKDIPLTGYYDSGKGIKGRYCSSCIRKNQNDRNYKRVMSEGGSERIPVKPNSYVDEFQKAQTFYVLEALGWEFNEDTGIWSKLNVKDKFGVWVNIIPQPKIKWRPDGVIVRKKHGVHKYINEIVQHREQGATYPELAYIYCCSHTTIRKIINDYYREKRTD